MIDWDSALSSVSGTKHKWVKFYNPRNQRVRITACARCGIAKGPISNSVQCEPLGDSAHHMRKMGWEETHAS